MPPSGPDPARRRAPASFDLDPPAKAGKKAPSIEVETDFIEAEAAERPLPAPEPARAFPLLGWVLSALGGFLLLVLAEGMWRYFLDLFARQPALGYAALALLGIALLGFLIFVLREAIGLLRFRKVARLRERAAALGADPPRADAVELARALAAFYADDPGSAEARVEIARLLAEPHDGDVLVAATERVLLGPKDALARQAIAEAAQRTALITALSPRAWVDVLFVFGQSLRLLRRIAAIYGGRADGAGFLRLLRAVLGHLAVTGGVAVAESMLGQVLGAGLAARLSAKLGEGVLNGVLTARVGLAALTLSRPMPFGSQPPILLSEIVKAILSQEKIAEKPAAHAP